jgi:hypothetical protein
MIGDQDVTAGAAATLRMMKAQGVDLVLLAGDIGYGSSTTKWKNQLAQVFGANYPFLISAGNHDWDWDWTKEETQRVIYDRAEKLGTCKGFTGTNMVCTFKGVTIVHVAPGVTNEMHDEFIAQAFAAYPSRWRICVWHKNQNKMQLGNKKDEAGWQVYEECRRQGAIIQTGHDHQYARTHTMERFSNQKVKSTSNEIVLQHEIASAGRTPVRVGTTFAFVNGLGGAGIRQPQKGLHRSAWWAKTLSSGQEYGNAKHGAVICEFNKGGVTSASCEFLQHDGDSRDSWTLKTNVPNSAYASAKFGGVDGVTTVHSFVVSKLLSGQDDVVETTAGQDCTSPSVVLTDGSGQQSTDSGQQSTETTRLVGIRFGSVDLDPADAKHIVTARIDFTVAKETPDNSSVYFIRAEEVENSPQLCGSDKLSARSATTQEVRWQPELWDGSGENIRKGYVVSSPNLVSLVQDIVSTGWKKGGAMTFLIYNEGDPQRFVDRREVYSFEQNASLAPRLILELEELVATESGPGVDVSASAPLLLPGSALLCSLFGLVAAAIFSPL